MYKACIKEPTQNRNEKKKNQYLKLRTSMSPKRKQKAKSWMSR